MRMRTTMLGALGVLMLVVGCGYGKDTGPKTPKTSPRFAPLADRFKAKCQTCYDDVFHVVMNRQMTEAERADKAKQTKALTELRTELMQCMTGKGYGNETQVEASVVEVWLAKTGCPQFAAAAKRHDVVAMSEINHDFHVAMGAACGNKYVRELYEDLLEMPRAIWAAHSSLTAPWASRTPSSTPSISRLTSSA